MCRLRDPYRPEVCDADRARLHSQLDELGDLALLVPHALVPGSPSAGPKVAISREAPLPLRLAALNLIGPAAPGEVSEPLVPVVRRWTTTEDVGNGVTVVLWHRGLERDETGQVRMVPAGDQTGVIPIRAAMLEWVADWAQTRRVGERGPGRHADTRELAMWLRQRVDWACDHHPGVADFAEDLALTLFAARAVLDLSHKPTRYEAPCPGCGLLSLQRPPGRADYIECRNCGRLLTEAEYATRSSDTQKAS